MRLLQLAALAASAAAVSGSTVDCDVIVAGGSLASLSAAVTAANVSASSTVCFLEITDWPGGQMTASAVPAIDFGPKNRVPSLLPRSFNDLLFGPLMPNNTNLGDCWVSAKCFQPQIVMEKFIFPLLAAWPNLKTFLRTAVTGVSRDGTTGAITSITAVQRTPAAGTTGWEQLLSAQLSDWYDPSPSAAYPSKEAIQFQLSAGGVVIEATEFGDVLAAGQLPMAQGIESPNENSTSYISSCGQAMTIPLYVSYGYELAPSPDPIPAGDPVGEPWGLQGETWTRAWTYRRSHAIGGSSIDQVVQGEISNQNIGGGNDFINGYLFYSPSSPEYQAQLAPGAWRGGVNITALALAEQRAYGYYHFFKDNCTIPGVKDYLSLNKTQAGTEHGLAKMPYLRDTRRSAGGINFVPSGAAPYRLSYPDLHLPDPHSNATGQRWNDTISIGQYFYADCHKMDQKVCPYPSYFPAEAAPVLPYYIPFRALTVSGTPNLLVAGKSMAMTFWANAATRLHPEEWSTGCAAGAAAALMVQKGWAGTEAALANIGEVQGTLLALGVPLHW